MISAFHGLRNSKKYSKSLIADPQIIGNNNPKS